MNQRLSEMRASAIRRALLELCRIESGCLSAVRHGTCTPTASNQAPEGRQTNRRVQLVRQ
jgi:outer membrane protein OmpA-like peptidoglycan-associated protein